MASLISALTTLGYRFSVQPHDQSLGAWLKTVRRGLSLSQQSLCRRAGVSKPTIIQVEANQDHISSLVAVMEALGLALTLVPTEECTAGPYPMINIHIGDCLDVLLNLRSGRFQACITSPPYFRQRDYGMAGQIGWEPTVQEYVDRIVAVMREVRRVLRKDGTLWLVIGDTYAKDRAASGWRRKEILGIPWQVAFALRDDGWLLRQDMILSKNNPLPEPVKDRFTRSHEYLFLLTKSPRYYFNAEAVREKGDTKNPGSAQRNTKETHGQRSGGNTGLNAGKEKMKREIAENGYVTRNKRSVWTTRSQTSQFDHFATFPESFVETCIRAGSAEGGLILDPFGGVGTTGAVARKLGRGADMIEINPEYAARARKRCSALDQKLGKSLP